MHEIFWKSTKIKENINDNSRIYRTVKEEMVWTDPNTFPRKFDAHTLVDDLKCAIVIQKNSNGEFLTAAEALAYLNSIDKCKI